MKKTPQKRTKKRANPVTPIYKTRRFKIFAAIAIVLAAALIAFGAWRVMTRGGNDRPTFTIQTIAPTPRQFTDDNFANMISADGTASVPRVNNNRKMSNVSELVVRYDWDGGKYAPVFRPNVTSADISRDIKITPFIRGTWRMYGGAGVAFTPDAQWPANQKFSVTINKKLINGDVHVNSRTASFATPDITARVAGFDIYPAPNDKKSMVGVAVISFNYPVETRDFAKYVSLRLDNKNLEFNVEFDKFHQTAIITSRPVSITDAPQVMQIKLNPVPAQSGNAKTKKIDAKTTIESADNFFKVANISTIVADDENGAVNQLLLIDTTTAAAADDKWEKFITLYLLPKYNGDDESDRPHTWAADEITPAVLKKSKQLSITPMKLATAAGEYRYAFSYDVSEQTARFIYVDVKPGIRGAAGFKLKNGVTKVLRAPYPQRSVTIVGDGALLSMSGDKKLGIVARGGADAAYVNLYRVKSDEINHLISQTYNVFSDIQFKSWSFGVYDMASVFTKRIPFANTSLKAVNYASVDLGQYLNKTNDATGIFIIQTGTSQSQADYNDKRLILLTDMGIIRKINLDGTSDIFVANVSDGRAAANIDISVLGRNGNAVWTGHTDATGHAIIPNLPWSEYRNAKEPVAIVAKRGNDVSFIPYDGAYTQRVEYSKFNIDGEYSSATNPMNAFIFSDRGIYRPGENVIIGAIVKNADFKSLAGIPVKMEIRDSRGRVVYEKTLSLATDGMFDVKFDLAANAPTGEYMVQLYSLNAKNKIQNTIGNASLRVAEFVPDNLKITATINGANDAGWILPQNMSANVTLRNLFGTPAADKRVSARATLIPVNFSFAEYAQYTFTPNFISGTGLSDNTAMSTIGRELPDVRTDENGNAQIDIDFDTEIPAGTYTLSLNISGFEGGDTRAVQTNITARVGTPQYLIGYRADSNLAYINRNATRSVNLVAIDNTGARTAANDLTMRVIRRENMTSLVKDGNDYYKYQTVSRDNIITEQKMSIPKKGTDINLDTATPGTYYVQLINSTGKIMANIEYFVAGGENVALTADRNAQLQIKLNAAEYAPGDDIAVSITAPYAGTGLITIERDKVYAYRWFNANTSTSVQHISLPAGFEGTGYINVSFVRDITSRDIFTNPYTYAVAPFAADKRRRTIDVSLNAPNVVRDNKLTVEYKTNKNAKLMIFAVNTGILQVAKYNIPNPPAHFFKKYALQVETYQILSLLLPEYKILREFAKTGGGDFDASMDGGAGGTLLNPFARKQNAPVAFYSGIINTSANKSGKITFDIPQYFNGAISVFAIAANNDAVGAADTSTRVQSPIIISANTPAAVAPGDAFDVNAVVSNLSGNKSNADINVSATASGGLTLNNPKTTLTVMDGGEKLWAFRAAVTDTLGNADIKINARMADKNATITRDATNTISVRPITPFETDIRAGFISSDTTTIKNFHIDTYPEYAVRTLYISNNAAALVRPLLSYLNNYEYTCSEQLVSRAIPYATMAGDKMAGITRDAAAKKISDTVGVLKNRQNDDGSFELWAAKNTDRNNASDANAAYVTAYVMQFLTIAKQNGFTVPQNMYSRGLDFLRTYAGTQIRNEFDAAAHAFAIYVITSNEYVTTSYINMFEEYANKNIKNWEQKLMGAYVAASYKLLHQDDAANALIEKYKSSAGDAFAYVTDFDNNVANDAIYQYIRHNYFNATSTAASPAILKYINSGRYSSYTSAMVIMAMSGNANRPDDALKSVSVTADGVALQNTAANGFDATIPVDAKRIEIKCPKCDANGGIYYTILQQGYKTASTPATAGLDIVREYYDENGNRITSAKIGDVVTVKIFARTRGATDTVSNAVIVDLLPGGFIPDTESVTGDYDFSDIREDRVLVYANINRAQSEFSYTARVGTAGTFAIPPIYGASMYNPQINATGNGGTFTVLNATAE